MAKNWHKEHRENRSFLDRIGIKVTGWVGTMICAVVFMCIALVSAPAAFESGNPVIIVQWVSGNFLQLVLLSVILFGTNEQSKASEAQSNADFETNVKAEKEIEQLNQILINQNTELAEIKKLLGNGKKSK
jgi:uncharacterized membrane protein